MTPFLDHCILAVSENPALRTYTWPERVYVLLVFGAAVLAAALAAYAWRHREQTGATPFAVFMGLVALWCATSGIFAAASTASTALFWNNIGISVAMYAPFAFLIFSVHYTGHTRWLTGRRYAMLLGISTLFVLALWTNRQHHRMFDTLTFSRQGALMMWAMTPGPAFMLHIAYSYGQILFAIGLIARFFLHSLRFYRYQMLALLIGFFPPIATTVADAGMLMPGMPELAPIGFAFMGLAFAWALFRHRFLDVGPVARDVLIDNMDDGMLVLDTHARIVDINRAMELILGLTSATLIGQPAETIAVFWNTIATSIRQPRKMHTEVRFLRNGTPAWYDLRVSPIANRRRFTGHLLVLRDITDRKLTEQQLLKLRKAVETTEVGVTITNPQGIIEYTNPAEAAMHGYGVEELLGQPSAMFASPTYRRPPDVSIEGVDEFPPRMPDPHWMRESVNVRKDGREFAVKLISNPIYNDQGKMIGRVTVCEDITARKQAEVALLAAHRELQKKNWQLQELNASKDKFFAIISHDLRNPFTSLLGFAQLLDANALTYTPAEVQHRATRIRSSAERLYALLENLLTWSRLQRGVMEYHPVQLDLRELVIQNFDLFQSKSEDKQIALCNRIAPGTAIYADTQMLDTVLRNLLSNALKFTPPGGAITVAAEPLERELQVSVADTGVGMDADTQAKLFREDVQHTSPGTAGEQGTGLGLLLCQELVHKNGGTLQVNSIPHQGTTFVLTVPLP